MALPGQLSAGEFWDLRRGTGEFSLSLSHVDHLEQVATISRDKESPCPDFRWGGRDREEKSFLSWLVPGLCLLCKCSFTPEGESVFSMLPALCVRDILRFASQRRKGNDS